MRSDIIAAKRLGKLEHLVMEFVWTHAGSTAEQCREAIAAQRPLRESTVRTVLTRLEQKGLVRHEVRGRTFHYRAVTARSSFAARAVRQIVDQFCDGSVEQLLVGLVDSSILDRKTLEKVARKIGRRGGSR